MEKKSENQNVKTIVKRIIFGISLIALLIGLTLIAVWAWRDKKDTNGLLFCLSLGWTSGVFTFLLVVIPKQLIHLLYWLRSKMSKLQNDEMFEALVVSEDLAYKKRYITEIFTFVTSILMFAIAIIMAII